MKPAAYAGPVGDAHWMAHAVALGDAARGTTAPNPNVGCVLVRDGASVGEGATQPGGRPHAEAVALAAASDRARGSTVYTTLEPCAHLSTRGPACADALIAARVSRVCAGLIDPDPRTGGQGFARLREAGIAVDVGTGSDQAARSIEGFLMRQRLGRPFVTLKLALSIDGRIATADGTSRWITGPEARTHVHHLRARSDAVLVGRGTYDADAPMLDVRIPGLENRSPHRLLLTVGDAPKGWVALASPQDTARLHDVNDLLVEGGGHTAAAFLKADLVDRVLIYIAPILIGAAGRAGIGDLPASPLVDLHGRWQRDETLLLGPDILTTYERTR